MTFQLASVSLLSSSAQLGSGTGVALAPLADVTVLSGAAVSQTAYELVAALRTGAAAAPLVTAQMLWQDSATGDLVAQQQCTMYTGGSTSALQHNIVGRGPSRGDRLTIVLINNDPANAATVDWTLLQNSRTYTNDLWHTVSLSSIPGLTLAQQPGPIPAGILETDSASVNAGQTRTLVMPLYTGPVQLRYATGSNTSDGDAQIFFAASMVSGDNVVYHKFSDGSGHLFEPVILMPRIQCQISLHNGNAAAKAQTHDIYLADVA